MNTGPASRLRRIDMIRRRQERRERASGQGRTSNDRSDNAAIAAREERRLLQDTEEFVDGLLRQVRVREAAIAERRREVLLRQTTATRQAPDPHGRSGSAAGAFLRGLPSRVRRERPHALYDRVHGVSEDRPVPALRIRRMCGLSEATGSLLPRTIVHHRSKKRYRYNCP